MNHPGSTDFDVKDRLAIINLINGYADCFDKKRFGTVVYAIYGRQRVYNISLG